MGLMHQEYPDHGAKFHPESILTNFGKRLLENFLKLELSGEQGINLLPAPRRLDHTAAARPSESPVDRISICRSASHLPAMARCH